MQADERTHTALANAHYLACAHPPAHHTHLVDIILSLPHFVVPGMVTAVVVVARVLLAERMVRHLEFRQRGSTAAQSAVRLGGSG
jgi:hypothetical protein